MCIKFTTLALNRIPHHQVNVKQLVQCLEDINISSFIRKEADLFAMICGCGKLNKSVQRFEIYLHMNWIGNSVSAQMEF